MRILLVKPYPELLVAKRLQAFLHLEPLELEIVAGGVLPEDDVRILDLSLEKRPLEVFESGLSDFAPDLVGFGGYSSNASVVKKLAGGAKAHSPEVITVAGGIHATIMPADYAIPDIDVIIRGEGGTALRELIGRAKAGEPLSFDDRSLSPSDADFQEKAALPPPVYPPVDQIPAPRRDLVDRSRYFCVWTSSPTGRMDTIFPRVASLRTSQGCAFSCSFCVVPHLMNGKYLQREPEDVVDELEGLEEEHIYFVDDEMFLSPRRVTRIAELLLERGVKKHYISWARSDTIVKHPELFRLWKQAGLSTVYVGLESMEDSRLDEYHKRTGMETNRKAVELLDELGITLHASFIVNPDFSIEDFRRLEKEVLALCPAEVTFTVLSPSPGTQFWEETKDRFICADPYLFYDCMHTLLPARLPLKRFYAHFSHLTNIALRANPLRVNKVRAPFRDILRAIVSGTKYIFALRAIHRDYRTSGSS